MCPRICLFGVLRHFQHCTGHITTGSWKGRGNQYIQFTRVLYCKLPTNGKQLPAFPLTAMTGIEPWPQRWEARVLPLCHRGPSVSEEELFKILKSSSFKSCNLHPIPTSLVKECADMLITPITNIVNFPITEGSFNNGFKMVHVTYFQKKPSLDRNILKNYKPVSNLNFISKLIAKLWQSSKMNLFRGRGS